MLHCVAFLRWYRGLQTVFMWKYQNNKLLSQTTEQWSPAQLLRKTSRSVINSQPKGNEALESFPIVVNRTVVCFQWFFPLGFQTTLLCPSVCNSRVLSWWWWLWPIRTGHELEFVKLPKLWMAISFRVRCGHQNTRHVTKNVKAGRVKAHPQDFERESWKRFMGWGLFKLVRDTDDTAIAFFLPVVVHQSKVHSGGARQKSWRLITK